MVILFTLAQLLNSLKNPLRLNWGVGIKGQKNISPLSLSKIPSPYSLYFLIFAKHQIYTSQSLQHVEKT